ncbi:MAG: DNRLRE domain-containing protein [Phycisphaerae bacterium]|nr:DNRLRE domain-containing protein [Phycisphaerae bacterium]
MTIRRGCLWSGVALLVGGWSGAAQADTILLRPVKDNTLYESFFADEISNGAGEYMFAGRTNDGPIRRSVFKFDLSAIPAGSTITSARLTLRCSRAAGGTRPARIHRLTADWGEGASNAFAPGGQGITAEPGDCTWTQRFTGMSMPWTNQGGDFLATVTAQTNVGGAPSTVVFASNANTVADAQFWLDNPAQNFGWILRGDETPGVRAGKRYDTRESPTEAFRPLLVVDFTPPPLLLGDMNCDGIVSVGDIAGFVLALTNPAQYAIDFPTCDIDAADVNQDSVISVGDIAGFVALLVGP